MNRSFYLQNQVNQSGNRNVSVSPHQNTASGNKLSIRSKDKQQQQTPSHTSRNREGSATIYHLLSSNRTNSNIQSLVKKQSLNDSTDRKRKQSPIDRSPINTRLSTLHKSRQITVSQSQQALNQVLQQIQMQHIQQMENQQQVKRNKSQIESLSSQKSTLNSQIMTNSSNKPQRLSSVSFEEYNKLVKEFCLQSKLIKFLKQKVYILEQVNNKILSLTRLCDECTVRIDNEVTEYIQKLSTMQTMIDLNIEPLNIQEDLISKSIKLESLDSEDKLQNLFLLSDDVKQPSSFYPTQSKQVQPRVLNELLSDHIHLYSQQNFLKECINRNSTRQCPSTLRALFLTEQ